MPKSKMKLIEKYKQRYDELKPKYDVICRDYDELKLKFDDVTKRVVSWEEYNELQWKYDDVKRKNMQYEKVNLEFSREEKRLRHTRDKLLKKNDETYGELLKEKEKTKLLKKKINELKKQVNGIIIETGAIGLNKVLRRLRIYKKWNYV